METLGFRIARLRKEKGLTQEDIAVKFNISTQAVSKWEKDSSSPDIMILKDLSNMLGVSIEYLLHGEEEQKVRIEKKDINKMILKIKVLSSEGDNVVVNLPMPIILLALEKGLELPKINGKNSLKDVDLHEIIKLVEQGVIGELVSVNSSEGDIVSIIVE
jgi:transcriptional regulator with XRE-family HTH domain